MNLKKLLGLKVNDWTLIWSDYGEWETTIIDRRFSPGSKYHIQETKEKCIYNIYYSKCRNKFKLEMSGENPEQHSQYNKALTKLIEFNKTINKQI